MSNELLPATIQTMTAVELFTTDTIEGMVSFIQEEARKHKGDLTTDKGRKAIASNAARVAKSKTFVDKIGKQYVAELKAKPKEVDALRKQFRDACDELKEEVRRELTEWEEAEKERVRIADAAMIDLNALSDFGFDDPTVKELSIRLDTAKSITISDLYGDRKDEAEELLDKTINVLTAKYNAAVKREEEQAELKRLQKEADERAQKDREEAMKAEAAQKAKEEAERKAENDRIAAEEEANAKIAAELKAKEDAEAAAQKAESDLLEAEARHRAEIEEAEQRERDKITQAALAEAEEKAKREADEAHVKSIESKVKFDLMNVVDSDTADALIELIKSGGVKHVEISY